MNFRPCPSYPGYSATLDGTIRRDPWIKTTCKGKRIEQPARVVKHVGRCQGYVTLAGIGWVAWRKLVEDAWIDHDRPRSSYSDGVVITLAEFIALKTSA